MKLDSSAFVADQQLLDALDPHAKKVECTEDCILFSQGDEPKGVYLLLGGTATLTMRSHTGDILLYKPAMAGALLGLPGVIGNQPYSLTARAVKGATLGFVSQQDFTLLMIREPSLSMCVLRVLAAEVSQARQAISEA